MEKLSYHMRGRHTPKYNKIHKEPTRRWDITANKQNEKVNYIVLCIYHDCNEFCM